MIVEYNKLSFQLRNSVPKHLHYYEIIILSDTSSNIYIYSSVVNSDRNLYNHPCRISLKLFHFFSIYLFFALFN